MATSKRTRAPLVLAALLAAAGLAGCGGKTVTQPPSTGFGQRLLAFASDRNQSFDIFVYDLTGLFPYNLPNLNDTSAVDRSPSLGSDGQVLAFVTDRASGMGLDILIYDLLGGVLVATPALHSAGDEDDPAFTGNALSLVFVRDTVSGRRIRYFNGVADRFVPLPGIDAPGGFDDWAPAPDLTGARIAFVSDRNGKHDIFVYDAGGDSLLDLPDLASDSTDTEPSLTSDARYLAFASTRAGGMGGYDLYLYDLSTKSFVTLGGGANSAADDRNPTISPDASVISFESDRAGGIGAFDVWNHNRSTGATGQGPGQNSTGADLQPSIRWP